MNFFINQECIMFLLLLYLFVAIFFSFLCSTLEAILLSTTPSYVEIKMEEKKSYAFRLKKMKDDIDKPLAAILSLNTFAHTIGAAGVGAQAQEIWGSESLTIVSIVLTLLILFFSEIIPKTIGATFWKQLLPFAVPVLRFLILILYPLVIVSTFLTKIINKRKKEAPLTRSDFLALAKIGSRSGLFSSEETKIMENLIKLRNIHVKDIMTPRTVVTAAREDISVEEFYQEHKEIRFSRIPLYKEQSDDITGFCLRADIFEAALNGDANQKLKDLKRDIFIVFEMYPVYKTFHDMISRREHIALVINEYGGMEGIITIEDIIETLIGMEIVDEKDVHEDMQKLAVSIWNERKRN